MKESPLMLKTPVKPGSASCVWTLVTLQHIDNEDTEKISCMLMAKERLTYFLSLFSCTGNTTKLPHKLHCSDWLQLEFQNLTVLIEMRMK